MNHKKIVLIDGNSIAYRAFFALPFLNNKKGIYTNAVYGFTMMLLKIIEDEKPTHILTAFDAGKTTFRHKTFAEYKGTRQKTPHELSEQFPYIHEILDAFQIKRYELEQYEADDIIGTLAKKAESEGFEVKVISGDKDLLQLVSDSVTVALTKKGITEVDSYTTKEVYERYGLKPEQIIDLKALMGDSSDNIPGVPGVGEKTALKLLHEFHTVENVLSSIDAISGKKLKEKLEENKDLAMISKDLATIDTNAPIIITLDELNVNEYDTEKIKKLFTELEFHSLMTRVIGDEQQASEQTEMEELSFEEVTEIKEIHLIDHTAVIVEILNENYHEEEVLGIAIANENGRYFIPVEIARSSESFKQWALDESKKKVVFDAKQVFISLHHLGIQIKGIDFEVLLASYLLNPSDSSHDIASIANHLGYTQIQSDDDVYGKGAKKGVPSAEILKQHVVRKSESLFYLEEKLKHQLQENNQYELFYDLELPLSFVLSEMELAGIAVDVEQLTEMGKDLQSRLKTMEQEIYELAGETFNINSPKQLGVILFEKLNLPVFKKTKTGYSTSADILERLQSEHAIVEKILHFRQLGKLQSTYIEGLLKVVHKDTNKIHTRYNQALTQTGRLSSIDPNLQNIPIRLEEGRKIRKVFVPSKPDWILFAADYSQIELRVLAHISKDERLMEAFHNDMDIHTKTAMDVFGVSMEEVTSNMRRQAKAVNFGIVYGISDFGLSQNLGITRKEAKQFIDQYFEIFKGVKSYMEDIVQSAKQHGFVSTLLNRRRYLPDITSRNFNVRSFAERTAMNTPIQGSAADIIKKAMIDMSDCIKEENLQAKILLQVHDELVLEAPKDEIEKLKIFVPKVMENAVELTVPLKVDYAFGETWFDTK